MKKIITILAVVVSAGAFAKAIDHSTHGNTTTGRNHSKGMMNQISNLTPEQQTEYNALHTEHKADMQEVMLNIKEVDLKIQKEMLAEKPNQKNIDKLIDQKAELQAQKQKDMLSFKIEAKEKFGIEMMGGMMNGDKNCKMKGSKGTMNSKDAPMNKDTSSHSHH